MTSFLAADEIVSKKGPPGKKGSKILQLAKLQQDIYVQMTENRFSELLVIRNRRKSRFRGSRIQNIAHAFGPRTNANFNQGCQIT